MNESFRQFCFVNWTKWYTKNNSNEQFTQKLGILTFLKYWLVFC